jgi:hypothetical protein
MDGIGDQLKRTRRAATVSVAGDQGAPVGSIKLTPIPKAPEPTNLRKLKKAVRARWGVVPLIDILKEVVLRTDCLRPVTSVADCGHRPEETPAQRLPLGIYAYGTTARSS